MSTKKPLKQRGMDTHATIEVKRVQQNYDARLRELEKQVQDCASILNDVARQVYCSWEWPKEDEKHGH